MHPKSSDLLSIVINVGEGGIIDAIVKVAPGTQAVPYSDQERITAILRAGMDVPLAIDEAFCAWARRPGA